MIAAMIAEKDYLSFSLQIATKLKVFNFSFEKSGRFLKRKIEK